MTRLARLLLLLMLPLVLSACGGPGPESCAAPEWRRMGQEAALRGEPEAASLAALTAACAPYGPAAEAEWKAGYAEGLAEFCEPRTARLLGRRGVAVAPVCGPEKQAAFDRAYAEGVAERPQYLGYADPFYPPGPWVGPWYYGPRPYYRPYYYRPRPRPAPRPDMRPPDWPRR